MFQVSCWHCQSEDFPQGPPSYNWKGRATLKGKCTICRDTSLAKCKRDKLDEFDSYHYSSGDWIVKIEWQVRKCWTKARWSQSKAKKTFHFVWILPALLSLFSRWIHLPCLLFPVTSMHQATIFSRGPTLSWGTNLLWSNFSSLALHCSTWLSVAVPGWVCLFPLLFRVAPSMPYLPRLFPRSRTMSARNGLLAPRSLPSSSGLYVLLPSRAQVRSSADWSTRNFIRTRTKRFASMKTYWFVVLNSEIPRMLTYNLSLLVMQRMAMA